LKESLYRNRALTDVFEPGSTVKPFVVAAALDGGYVSPNATFATHGTFQIGRNTVKDVHNYGTLDLTHVIKKSSNVCCQYDGLKDAAEIFLGDLSSAWFWCFSWLGFSR